VAEIGGTVRHSIWCFGRDSCKPLGLASAEHSISKVGNATCTNRVTCSSKLLETPDPALHFDMHGN
jgi:hypothetical protein